MEDTNNADAKQDAINNEDSPCTMMKQYTEDEIDTLRIVFEMFDRDGSGEIDTNDLKEIASGLNQDPTEGTIHQT